MLYPTKAVCVYDYGTFLELAIKLSENYGKVYYYSPWQSSFPCSNHMLIGTGIDGVERVNNVWDVVNDVDVFVFPDVYCGDVQLHLESIGKRVWGSRNGEELEIYRKESKEYLKSIGIDVGPYEVMTGIADLRKYLMENDNQYVKISLTRGDTETFHAENYKLIEPKLDELEWKLGAKKYTMEFIVEAAIDDAVESGYDGYCIDGMYPSKGICGVEIKDKGYIAVFQDYKKMPVEITGYNDKLAETLKKYRYRNFISSELRITPDGTSYAIDPCMRAGSPPSEIYINMYENLAEIIWEGSGGVLVDPVSSNKYAIELVLCSKWADSNWQALQFPAELRNDIKFRDLAIIKGEYYVVPQGTGHSEVGAVVVLGNTLDEAIEKIKEYSERIKGYDLKIHTDVIDAGLEEIQTLADRGIMIDG